MLVMGIAWLAAATCGLPRPGGSSPSLGGAAPGPALTRWLHAPLPRATDHARHVQPLASSADSVGGRQPVAVHLHRHAVDALPLRRTGGTAALDPPCGGGAGASSPDARGAWPAGCFALRCACHHV